MSDKKPVTYKVIKEDKENYLQSTILKENVEVEFKLGDVETHKKRLVKATEELDAKARVHAAEMVNIEKNHPFVKDFEPLQLHAIGLYIDAIRELKQVEPRIEEYKNALEEYSKEEKEIYEQCNFDISNLVKEEEEEDEFADVEVSEEDSPNEKPDEGEEKPVKE